MFANTSKQLFVSNGSIIAGEPMDPWGYLLDIEEVHGCNFVFFFSTSGIICYVDGSSDTRDGSQLLVAITILRMMICAMWGMI